jgi:Flp pilus assembly protein TadB
MQLFFSLIGALGLGGILVALFQTIFEHKKQVEEHEHELKSRRYGAILILMLTKLDPKTGMPKIRTIRPDLKNLEDVEREIETELLNGVLFASDGVIKSLAEFVRLPSYATYIKTAVAMRRDLWGKKTSIDENILEVIRKDSST